jgi:DNA-binding XRE family transcriptional regulator
MKAPLHVRSRDALHLLQSQLSKKLGISRRTGQRWDSGESAPAIHHYQELAKMVFPVDPALAKELAAAGQTTLEALGLVGRSSPAQRALDSILCAAADVLDLAPRIVGPALAAAFERMRELGVSVEDVERALASRSKDYRSKSGPSTRA